MAGMRSDNYARQNYLFVLNWEQKTVTKKISSHKVQ